MRRILYVINVMYETGIQTSHRTHILSLFIVINQLCPLVFIRSFQIQDLIVCNRTNLIRSIHLLLATKMHMEYNTFAVLDGVLAVLCNLQSAIAGLKASMRLLLVWFWVTRKLLIDGSCAAEAYESRQVRKEAAVSGQTVCHGHTCFEVDV